MTQSNSSKIQTRPIEDLIGRIRTLRQQGQKQIILSAAEADRLADSLTLKTAKEAQTINIEMDGGNFSEKK